MLDFWESMGRMVANEDGLRDKVLALTAGLAQYQTLTCTATGAKPHDVALVIPETNYGALLQVLDPSIRFKPVSVFTLGEWLRILPLVDLAAGLGTLTVRDVVLTGRSAAFYACLGAITVDDAFANEYKDAPATAFPLVTDLEEIAVLQALAQPDPPNPYRTLAVGFCDTFWPEPCFVRVRRYTQRQRHYQPDLRGIPPLS